VSPKEHDDWKKQLHQAGALMVFKETDSMKNLRETGKQLDMKIKKQQSIEEQVTLFAEHARKLLTDKPEGTKKKKAKTPLQAKWEVFLAVDSNFKSILEKGLQTVRDTKQTAEGISAGAGFNATLKKLTMTNFMGIQGTVEVPLGIMKNGIWLIEGDNGSGKSTVFEAIGT
jgi:recombinational DNA repair ATPase RecF